MITFAFLSSAHNNAYRKQQTRIDDTLLRQSSSRMINVASTAVLSLLVALISTSTTTLAFGPDSLLHRLPHGAYSYQMHYPYSSSPRRDYLFLSQVRSSCPQPSITLQGQDNRLFLFRSTGAKSSALRMSEEDSSSASSVPPSSSESDGNKTSGKRSNKRRTKH